ncbi:MAG: hypothetical protein ACE15D_09970 [Candidatus Eisenbacteria bacterium]
MEFVPSRAQAHLVVAAVRVLSHTKKRPPTAEEMSELLGIGREVILHLARGLEAKQILRAIQNPFELRWDLEDPSRIDELPMAASGPDMGREIEDFHRRAEDRQKKIERMMRDTDPERSSREKAQKIEEEFRRFRSDRSKRSIFGPAGGSDGRPEENAEEEGKDRE